MTPREFEVVFKEHGPLVWSLIRKYHLPGADAEDLFMEIWEAVWKSLPGFQGKARLSTWIGGVARNKCVDHLQGKRVNPLSGPEFVEEAGSPTNTPFWSAGPSPREKAVRNESKKLIEKALDELSPVQKIIVKRWMLGFKYREIAEMLNAAGSRPVDENYVGKQLFLARKRIAGILKRKGIRAREDIWE